MHEPRRMGFVMPTDQEYVMNMHRISRSQEEVKKQLLEILRVLNITPAAEQ
jgi:hypothetical protein